MKYAINISIQIFIERMSQVHIYILYIPLILVFSLFDSLKAKNVKELLISADMVMVYTNDDDYFADKLWL